MVEKTLGEFRLTERALTLYEKWYMVYSKKLDDDPTLAGAMDALPTARVSGNLAAQEELMVRARLAGVCLAMDSISGVNGMLSQATFSHIS